MADFSLIIVSHNHPELLKEAIQCVQDQTLQKWEAVLVDSGILLEKGFFKKVTDPRIKVIPSGETPGMGRTVNMASYCFNKVLNSGMLTGELVMYLCDDDLLYKEAFETFWNYYIQHKREPQAMYGSQNLAVVDRSGKTKIIGQRIADRPGGKFCKGRKMDCQVDNLQFCHTLAILKKFKEVYKTDQYQSEAKEDAWHADGIFFEQIGALTKIHNINKLVSVNRRTATSANLEYSDNAVGRFLITAKNKFKGLKKKLASNRR